MKSKMCPYIVCTMYAYSHTEREWVGGDSPWAQSFQGAWVFPKISGRPGAQ